MKRTGLISVLSIVAFATVLSACTPSIGGLGSIPASTASPEPSLVLGSPDLTPAPSESPASSPSAGPDGSTATPAPTSSGTIVVRAYFYLNGDVGSAGLVPVLREVPSTRAVATAAMNALLSGPNEDESGASPAISSAVPHGTQLLGLSIDGGVATVDLSSEFESGGGSASVLGRLGQVVYTLTQFPTVKSVQFRIDGQPVTVFSSEGIVLEAPVDRADYVALLPAIFVDRPAWGAALGNPGSVSGNANVFEAQFRMALLDAKGRVLFDEPVSAECGTGCRGDFATEIAYVVASAQWGTLRVYDPSERDGSPESIRDYPVWLTPGLVSADAIECGC